MANLTYTSDICDKSRSVSFSDNVNFIFYDKKNKEDNKDDVEYVEVVHNTSRLESTDASKESDKEDKEEKKEKKTYSTHTKFCAFGFNKCSKGVKCIYAHTFKQLNPILCKWNEECLRKEKCYFKHSTETKVQYVKRAFPEDLKRLNIVLFEQSVYNKPPVTLKKLEEENEVINNGEENKVKIDDAYDEEEYKKSLRDLHLLYYDPAFEHYCWADINEFNEENDRH